MFDGRREDAILSWSMLETQVALKIVLLRDPQAPLQRSEELL